MIPGCLLHRKEKIREQYQLLQDEQTKSYYLNLKVSRIIYYWVFDPILDKRTI